MYHFLIEFLAPVDAGMYHQFDKDLRDLLEIQMVGGVDGKTGELIGYDDTKKDLWKPPVTRIFKILKTLGWDVKSEPYYPRLDACRMVVNAYKHGKGTSLDELRKVYPEYVRSPLERAGLPKPFGQQLIDHE